MAKCQPVSIQRTVKSHCIVLANDANMIIRLILVVLLRIS